MPHRILHLLPDLSLHFKLGLAFAVTSIATLADAVTDLKGMEDWGLKALLIAALVFVVKLLLKEQEGRRADAKEMQEAFTKHITANTDALDRMVTVTEEQTQYYKTVSRNLLNQKLTGEPLKLPE